MKITAIRARRLCAELDPPFHAAWDPVPRRRVAATLVCVETDEGITGVGSGDTMDGFEPFAELFIGQDPLAIARHVRTLETISFHAGRYWPLEAALWDIIGQVCGQPVSVLFGGAAERIPAYASCGELKGPEERAESALALREEGFRALKIRVQPGLAPAGVAAVAAVRAAVGDSMDILVDLNQAWRMAGDLSPALDAAGARRAAAELTELGVLWLEEPLPLTDRRGIRDLRQVTGMRIAGGEMTRTLDELLDYLADDLLDVYQPDVVLAAGMSRVRLVAETALARNRWFSPHTWTNGLGLLANLHVATGVGGGPYLEFPYDPPGWTVERRDFFLAEPIRVGPDGCVAVPSRPGLGALLDGPTLDRLEVT
ncbi:MAG TPA: mandelate racemase/muconate lactonizing enzyme family protein [Chloroflexota bacterium]|nr:mandelate racemase/muconate lactonizing enzyme family protein [Chloroflexota bacterium]